MHNNFKDRIPTWYNPRKDDKRLIKPPNPEDYIYFPSHSEYKCYRLLRQHFRPPHFSIGVHCKLTLLKRKWNIDFRVSAITPTGREKLTFIANSVNKGSIEGGIDCLYIEYKGLQDNNFRHQFTHFLSTNSILCSRIILVSDTPNYFVIENLGELTRLIHPIASITFLESAILRANLSEAYRNGNGSVRN